MSNAVVRIERIKIEGLKNVELGEISLSNPRRPGGPSILGLYGQNGSGKSALVDALEITKQCMTGTEISRRFARYVNIGTVHARIECEMSIRPASSSTRYSATYAFSFKGEREQPSEFVAQSNQQEQAAGKAIRVFDECLSIKVEDARKGKRATRYIDTSAGSPFGPAAKRAQLVGTDTESEIDLAVEKKLAYRESRSFMFSETLRKCIRDHVMKTEGDASQNAEDAQLVLDALHRFSLLSFFVLNTRESGMSAIGALPFTFRSDNDKGHRVGFALIPIEGTNVILNRTYDTIAPIIENTNIVLQQLVPGLSISLEVLGTELTRDGNPGKRVQLVSVRDGRSIPLACESNGIIKIVSFLHLLILMHNDPSVTVVIDELDSGLFEYLLGELLSIVSEHGRGQLIFTSHNLRPLETIDRGFIAFTTVNPKHRYTRMKNVKATNNLRDFYYRDIILGGQDEPLYEPTSNGDIEFAFMEAGFANGK